MATSILLLGLALKAPPVGTAYTVRTVIGEVGTAAVGMLLLGEPATALRIGGVTWIAAGTRCSRCRRDCPKDWLRDKKYFGVCGRRLRVAAIIA
jgi:hypothetical protein